MMRRMRGHIQHVCYISFLAILAMLGFFASDMYLPALPSLAQGFQSTNTSAVMSISLYLWGLALGQLVYGSLSDRYGRKPVLCVGTFIFTLASYACYISPTMPIFLVARLFQALGVSAAAVLWQSMVVDRFGKAGSHRYFALILPLLGLSPALAPAIGGVLIDTFRWEVIFLVLTVVGVLLLVASLLIEETQDVSHRQTALHFKSILSNYRQLLTAPTYIGYVLMVCFATAMFFAYLAGSPFLLKQVGFTVKQIGVAYVPQTLMFMLGGFLSKKWVSALGTRTTLKIALSLSLLCGVLLALFGMWGFSNGREILLPFLLVAVANGVIYPTCLHIALNHFPSLSGTASGLSGCLQAVFGFAGTCVVASFVQQGAIAMPIILLVLAVGNLLLFRYLHNHIAPAVSTASTVASAGD